MSHPLPAATRPAALAFAALTLLASLPGEIGRAHV